MVRRGPSSPVNLRPGGSGPNCFMYINLEWDVISRNYGCLIILFRNFRGYICDLTKQTLLKQNGKFLKWRGSDSDQKITQLFQVPSDSLSLSLSLAPQTNLHDRCLQNATIISSDRCDTSIYCPIGRLGLETCFFKKKFAGLYFETVGLISSIA